MKIRELKISEIQPAAYNPQEESTLKTKSKGKRRKSNTVPGASDIEVLGGSVGGSMKRSYSQNPSEKRFAINDQVVLDGAEFGDTHRLSGEMTRSQRR